MAELLKQIFVFAKEVPARIDPRTDYFLASSFVPVTFILVFYLAFVLKLGPQFMKNRLSFDLNKITIAYNVVQVIFNTFLVVKATESLFHQSFFCSPIDWTSTPRALVLLDLHYFYFVIKVLDLLDTVIMVLRKKFSQISFLHVYHHAGIVFGSFISFKFFPGGQLLFLGYINGIVHIVMYCYYLLTAIDSSYKDSLWWKKYLTQFQILQHVVLTIMFSMTLVNPTCTYPKFVAILCTTQGFFFIILFSHFYYLTYCATKLPKIKKYD